VGCVAAASPSGNPGRRQDGPNSDVDLLVIKSGRFNYGDSPWLVIGPALKEGTVVYAA